MRLDEYMVERGIKDDAMAVLVGTDRSRISRLRRGLAQPSWELAARIKEATGGSVTADSFLPSTEAAQ